MASQQAGDFVLHKNKEHGLVFIAGGIGVTPFRSMIQFLLDTRQKRDITIIYSNKTVADVAYKDIFDRAERELGIRTVYVITGKDQKNLPMPYMQGKIDGLFISNEISGFENKIYYISGPRAMVVAYRETLKSIGVKRKNIKVDFFPGFA